GDLLVPARDQPAHPAHREKVAKLPVATRIALELLGRVSIPENDGEKVALAQVASAARGELEARILPDLLQACGNDVPGVRDSGRGSNCEIRESGMRRSA